MPPLASATCPRCRTVGLDELPLVRHCPRCKGSWISEETLHRRAAAAGPRRLAWRREARAALACAVCAAAMETLVIQGTPVDRCAAHGVWFDVDELAHVLALHAAAHDPGAPTRGAAAAQAIETRSEPASSTTDVVDATVFEVVVEGVGWVAGTVVEIVAGIFAD